MATRRKCLKDDVISELPEEIKHRILECLPTYEAARTALLSKHWNDVWSRHHRLVFDEDLYFECVPDSQGNKRLALANIIYDVLLRRTGPVKKFTLRISDDEYIMPKQYDLDRWCLILSRNGVQQLYLMSCDFASLRLPLCIFSCQTIEILKLSGFIFDFPLNVSCIFRNITSLLLDFVSFEKYEIVSTIPNLEKIVLMDSSGFGKLKLRAPKLESLVVLCDHEVDEDEWKWVKLYRNTIKTLCLSPDWLVNSFGGERYLEPGTFPTAMNLQTLRLSRFCLQSGKHVALALQLLRKSPNLCQLEINASYSTLGDVIPDNHKEVALRLLEDPDNCSIDQNLQMLRTVKIESFGGTELEMHFVKTLLSKSPALDKLIITRGRNINASEASKIAGELLSLPRASQKVQVDFIMRYPYDLISELDFWYSV